MPYSIQVHQNHPEASLEAGASDVLSGFERLFEADIDWLIGWLDFPQKQFNSWFLKETSQELRKLSSVTINCQVTKIVMNSGSQLSEL